MILYVRKILISDLPTVSTGTDSILSSDDTLADLFIKLLLLDLNLSLVDLVQDKLPRGDSVKTDERMGVLVVSEDMFFVAERTSL